MLRMFFSAAILLAGFIAPAQSLVYWDDGRSYAVWEEKTGGALFVIASYETRNGCARFVDQHIGAPHGRSNDRKSLSGVVQVTFTIEQGARNCRGPVTTVRKWMATTGAVTDDVVEIFYVSTSGKLLKTERIAIRG
ncbi:MAG: hypothetical protein K8F25_02310 [Fimbriimonadaceae bacterium]|nr:hypothetical protein [Alphaproteobacteria bacterium]